MNENFLKETTLYTGALGAALLIAYGFHMIATRLLGVAGYGVFSKYFGVLLFITLPTFLVQNYIAREVASGKNPTKRVLIDLMKVLVPLAILMPFLNHNLIYVSVGIISYALYIYRGYLQGKHQRKKLAINLVLEPIFRVGFLILLVKFLNLNFRGALLSFTLAYIIVLIPSLKVKWGMDKSNLFSLLTFFIVSIAISIPTTLGITFASYVLSPVELSQYSIIILLSKLIVFLSFSIGMAYLPMAVEEHNKKNKTDKELGISMYILIGISLLFILFPQFFALFFPPAYSTAIDTHLPLLSVSMLLIGVSYILMNKMWSEKKDKYTLIPSIIFIILELYYTFSSKSLHSQAVHLLYASIILFISVILINLLTSKLVRRHERV